MNGSNELKRKKRVKVTVSLSKMEKLLVGKRIPGITDILPFKVIKLTKSLFLKKK